MILYCFNTPVFLYILSANATLSGNIYMGHPPQQYYKTLNAHVYNLEQGTLKGKVMVARDTCGLVGEVVYDLSDPGDLNY